MPTVRDILDRATQMIDTHRDKASSLGARYKFVLKGEGACTFVLNLTADDPGVREGESEADCTIRVAAADFVRMAEGDVDSRDLFFAGKLKVDGDMGLALKLKKMIASA
ncbi:SCP2 sterol-binding domain-containing protein [Methylosinus sp. LW3]|uniref:SCP2 sterol-binding domain-containing protein n=1 Tax=Methylosinus sp. LW3 TaxID=107635 RepID=UPI0004B35850|nr:SCP2 sterol-binding domain-containing protein [Methylosinus sp. LW3]